MAEASGRNAAWAIMRGRQKKALEVFAAFFQGMGEIVFGLHFFDQQGGGGAAGLLADGAPLGGIGGAVVYLDVGGERDQGLHPFARNKVIQRQGVAHPVQLGADCYGFSVWLDCFQDLKHGAACGHEGHKAVDKRLARAIDEGQFLLRERGEADEGAVAVVEYPARGLVGLAAEGVVPAFEEEQFVTDRFALRIEDGLAGHKAAG